jgi:5'-3' exonuclease
MSNKLTAILDLDAMLHIVANVQFKAGNRDNANVTKAHVNRFVSTIKKNSQCTSMIMFYQKMGHTNFRNTILPEYKGHRTTSDAIACWKPTIVEAFSELGAFGLQHIESDDAASIVADLLQNKVVIISSDKDMVQVPGKHYNPFQSRKNITPEERWSVQTHITSNLFFWGQVLSGDSTDMPNSMCGIEGIGPAKAMDLLLNAPIKDKFETTIRKAYTKHYGKFSYVRASRTYQMVRLLKRYNNDYINEDATAEVKEIANTYETYIQPITNSIESLFGGSKTSPSDLFNK